LSYVIVKHTGAQVGNGDELNGITFSGVGSGTIVNNLQVYSTFDDGIEMFGGKFDIDNYVALYVRDDSIDLDEGWQGAISNALVIQSESIGNHCIESDGIGSYDDLTTPVREDFVNRGLNTRAVINNLTCIISPTPQQGDFDPGAGWRFREGIWFEVNNSMIITSFAANDQTSLNDNYCLRIEDDETVVSAANGDSNLNSVVYACQENVRGTAIPGFADEQEFAEAEGNQFAAIPNNTAVSATAVNDTGLQLLEGMEAVQSIPFATSQIDGATPAPTAAPTVGDFLGAMSAGGGDYTRPWAYGIDPNNRAQPLWFEGQ
jgi:hypothetical protein